MIEEWKKIEGYEGLYDVSNLGKIKSFYYGKEKYLKPGIQKKGYSVVGLNKNLIKSTNIVSRLVAIHFIPNPNNLPLVCHKDETLDENGALYNGEDNLFWGTQSDNLKDMIRKGRGKNHLQLNHPMKGKFGKDNKSSRKVNQYTLGGEFIKEWSCIKDVERELLINQSLIIKVCRGKGNTAGGFIWKYN